MRARGFQLPYSCPINPASGSGDWRVGATGGTLANVRVPAPRSQVVGGTGAATFPTRQVVLARELTKKFEEYSRGTAAELLAKFQQCAPRGEFVVLVAPPAEKNPSEGGLES